MERTGATNIALRAAASGVIDYSRCDLHDNTWLAYYKSRIAAVRLQDRHTILQAKYAYYLSAFGSKNYDGTKVKRHVDNVFSDLQGWQNPVLGFSSEDRETKQEEDFKAQWEAIAGFSPDDVESLAAWESRLQEHLEKQRLERENEAAAEKRQEEQFAAAVRQIREKRLKVRR